MNDYIKDLNTAFDLDFAKTNDYPISDFKSVCILGGGTAGYLTALSLNITHPYLKINLIESSKIPVIGVGESTTTEIIPFLHYFLGIDPIEFFKKVEPTLKLGIKFQWGAKNKPPFNFNFFTGHIAESYFYDEHTTNCNWSSTLMENEKIPIINDNKNLYSCLGDIPFSYHLDNKKFVNFLKSKLIERNISITDAKIVDAEVSNNQITKVVDEQGDFYEADYFIDCSGFSSKLLGGQLKEDFISFKDTLPTDRALIFEETNNQNISPYTGAETMNHGWLWKIPMRKTNHHGYVYSSNFATENDILTELKQKKYQINDYKIIKFQSGRHRSAWVNNVFAIGNAYAFIEPLESTAIQTVIQSILLMCRLMPKNTNDKSSINAINEEIRANWDSFRWFLGIHYKFNNKINNEFWNWCNNNINIGNANEILSLFKDKAPLSTGHFGTKTGYGAYSPLVFNAYSYDSLLFGQSIIKHDKFVKNFKPSFSKQDYNKKKEAYMALTKNSITQNELFDSDLLYNEIIPNLFNDPHSWVNNTEI